MYATFDLHKDNSQIYNNISVSPLFLFNFAPQFDLLMVEKNWKYWLYQPYKWLIVIPVFGIDTLLGVIFTCIFVHFSVRLGNCFAILWAKVMQFITPMHVDVTGRENVANGQSYVIAVNHQSAYDIIAIYGSMGLDFKWVMKKELRNAPLLGYACYKLRHIFIDRSSRMASYRSIENAKQILTGGTSVVIFPEGTRSGSPNLGQFKHGAFKMATSLQLPILPVTLKNTYRVMSGGLSTLMPHRVEMIIHKPINPLDFADRQDELIAATRSAIADGL